MLRSVDVWNSRSDFLLRWLSYLHLLSRCIDLRHHVRDLSTLPWYTSSSLSKASCFSHSLHSWRILWVFLQRPSSFIHLRVSQYHHHLPKGPTILPTITAASLSQFCLTRSSFSPAACGSRDPRSTQSLTASRTLSLLERSVRALTPPLKPLAMKKKTKGGRWKEVPLERNPAENEIHRDSDVWLMIRKAAYDQYGNWTKYLPLYGIKNVQEVQVFIKAPLSSGQGHTHNYV